MTNPAAFPAVRGAGLFSIILGTAMVVGAPLGQERMSWAFVAGMMAAFAALAIFTTRLARPLGTPTKAHWHAIRAAASLLIALLFVASKVFHDDLLQGETRLFNLSILFAVAIHLMVFAVAAGPLMLLLAGLCIVNAGIGAFAPVPMVVVWSIDGLLKIGLGIAMLRTSAASAREQPLPKEELRRVLATVREIVKDNEEWRNSLTPAKGPFTDEDVVRDMARSARDAILLRPELLPGATSAPARSFFGGLPKLPPQLAWPAKVVDGDTCALTFIAQIDLGEVPRVNGSPLPESGTLYFFLDMTKEWLEDDDAKVLFHEQPATGTERQPSHASHESPTVPFQRCPIRFAPFRSHRSWLIDPTAELYPARPYKAIHRKLQLQSLEVALGPGSADDDRTATLNQMLGYGELVQSTPINRVEDVLLLQVAPNMYGQFWAESDPYGVIQFWISTDDLAARRFDRVGVNFDCT